MRLALALIAFPLLLAACQPISRNIDIAPDDAPFFEPSDMRIHPFTSVKDWNADSKVDGIEALVELQDRFRDPTKGVGTMLFELYTYRTNYPDPRGERLAAWRGSLLTLEEQRMHWNRISRTYSFQLAYPEIRGDRNYVLTVWFDHAGKRLTSQVILEPQEGRVVQPPKSTTQPTTQPATRPAAL
jgi:hypothetical protein